MKGIVFTEFLELVEQKFGLEMVDRIITQSNLESKGIYTAIGTYEFSEMLQLLQNLHNNTGIEINDLLRIYGEYFFSVLESNYGRLIARYSTPLDMLASIEKHIHVEVQKIYPDASLPTFDVVSLKENSLEMIYKSDKAMHHFGLGLMTKTFEHFDKKANIIMEKIKPDGTEVRFLIKEI